MTAKRPVNLSFTTINFPITAITSISHRICGVISWVGLGFALLALSFLLKSEQSFNSFVDLFSANFLLQFMAWGFLTAFAYYCVGCLKIFVHELGFFEDLAGGKAISWVAVAITVVLSILAGMIIWS